MCKRLIYHCSVTHIQLMRIIWTRRQQSLRYWSGRQCNAHIISVGRMECRRDGDKWRRARQNCVQLGSFFAGKTTRSSLRWTDGSFGDPMVSHLSLPFSIPRLYLLHVSERVCEDAPYHSLSPSGPPPPPRLFLLHVCEDVLMSLEVVSETVLPQRIDFKNPWFSPDI